MKFSILTIVQIIFKSSRAEYSAGKTKEGKMNANFAKLKYEVINIIFRKLLTKNNLF